MTFYISRYLQLHVNKFCQFWYQKKPIVSNTIVFQVQKNSPSDRRNLLELSHLKVTMQHELKLYWILKGTPSETPYNRWYSESSVLLMLWYYHVPLLPSTLDNWKWSFQKLCIGIVNLSFCIQSHIDDNQHLSLIPIRKGTMDREDL